MMTDFLHVMSSDMGINRFSGETDESFVYRLCYSALGLWCLYTAQNVIDGVSGTTKHNQTIVLNNLLIRFSEVFPYISEKFVETSNQQISFPVHIRRVYEETGYLLTDDNNRNRIANYGRSISIGHKALFFGLPATGYTLNGLGLYTKPTTYNVVAREFLIRDHLTCEEFFNSRFDYIDFYNRDISIDELEFFNPKSKRVPSQSWEKRMETDCTVARRSETGPYYRVMCVSDNILLFADEPIEQQNDGFTSYEYRRLYFALKAHYKMPLKATVTKIDEQYSLLRIGGHLPNREYYYLLLLSWPVNSAFDKSYFLIRNSLLSELTGVLANIGVKIEGGHTDGE